MAPTNAAGQSEASTASAAANKELQISLTCEGRLGDSEFPPTVPHPDRSRSNVGHLSGVPVKVRKLEEPWNSVRVTVSVPREAALRLRQLAQQGAPQLRALGILGVQLDGEGTIALRLQGAQVQGEPREVLIRTSQDGPNSSGGALGLGSLLSNGGGTTSGPAALSAPQVQFKSPNVVCPADSVVPRVVGAPLPTAQTPLNPNPLNKPPYAGPFPFASMNQAIQSQNNTGNNGNNSSTTRSTNMDPPSFLPPPYPGVRQSPGTTTPQTPSQPQATLSSPLLVNLLKNDNQDGATNSNAGSKTPELVAPPQAAPSIVRQMRPPPPPSPAKATGSAGQTLPVATQQQHLKNAPALGVATAANPLISSQANVLVNSSNNNLISNNSSLNSSPMSMSPPSALSTTTSNTPVNSTNNGSPVMSAQLAINNIANSLANAASTMMSNSALGQQQRLFGMQKATNFVPQHYQRTPHGSIIALNKPSSLSSSPIHQNLPVNQQQGAVMRHQLVPQKRAHMFAQNMLHHGQVKLVQGKPSAMLSTNGVTLSGNGSVLTQGTLPGVGVTRMVSAPAQVGLNLVDPLNSQVTNQMQSTSVINKPLPSPPPYNVAVSRNWDSLMGGTSNLLDLTPSLTDLKPDELDDLLPALDHDALPDLSELELLGGPHLNTNSGSTSLNEENYGAEKKATVEVLQGGGHVLDGRKFLINPLTGELEPHSGEESDSEEIKDVFTGLPSPPGVSDEDTNTTRPDTATDQSDSETRSGGEGKHSRIKTSKVRKEGRDSPAQKPEKIKLRLKLEKSEPVNPAYKVDVSFINTQQPKKASSSVITSPASSNEELRVPPLHISLRGRNSVVIKNKTKVNVDGTPIAKKMRKPQGKGKKEGVAIADEEPSGEAGHEHKTAKRFKANYEHKDLLATLSDDQPDSPLSKYSLHNHYKDKQKERRGSDSELVRANNKRPDANGAMVGEEKKRRLSQSESDKRGVEDYSVPSVLGSTNVGTVGVLPQKIRKDKMKIKDSLKIKDANRKLYSTVKSSLSVNAVSPADKQKQCVALPTAMDMDMEAKFKQSLMEGIIGEKGIPRPPHRTVEVIGHVTESVRHVNVNEKISKSPLSKEKSPEPDKCNVPDVERKASIDEKQVSGVVTSGGRSPNSGSSAGQGEDSGIESMDALSEKSPNQASQSPHADILPNVVGSTSSKTQVPDMLDIEAQLAKMEGLDHHHHDDVAATKGGNNASVKEKSENARQKSDCLPDQMVEDVNENECVHRSDSKPCCEITCALSSAKTGAEERMEGEIGPHKNAEKDDDQSNPLCMGPALYSYPSNPIDKGGGHQRSRIGSESPSITTEDEDSDMGGGPQTTQVNNKTKSLLEQLLIEIPGDNHGGSITPSSHSPATRSSVRTRALSKLGSPELGSPVPKPPKTSLPAPTAKRKRNESDSSNHSVDEAKKRPRKGSGKEASEVGKKTIQIGNAGKKGVKVGNAQNLQDESSDSDEPLIEKLRKNTQKGSAKVHKTASTSATNQGASASQITNKTNTRRSARAGQQQIPEKSQDKQQPAPNTRSREKVVQQQESAVHSNAEAEAALRRKTRSAGEFSKDGASVPKRRRALIKALQVVLTPLGGRK